MKWPAWLTLEFYKGVWEDFTEYFDDLPIKILKGILEAVADMLESLPAPDFLDSMRLADVLAPVMPSFGYFLAMAGVNHAAALLASAVVFRLMRKALTLGRW